MRTLEQALSEHELIVLRVIGEWWDLDLTGEEKSGCITVLAESLSQLDLQQELLYFPPEEQTVIQALANHDGRIPIGIFQRQFGEVRQMGPGKLAREEPWFEPINAAEALWYRGLLHKGFDETDEGLIEFYYLPNELAAPLLQTAVPAATVAAPAEPSLLPAVSPDQFQPAPTSAIDDLTTVLAEAQIAPLQLNALHQLHNRLLDATPARLSFILTLAGESSLLKQNKEGIKPQRTAIDWLQKSREEQLRTLMDIWLSSIWNALCYTPGLSCEGSSWQNDPKLARKGLLEALPRTLEWYAIADLTAQIKQDNPDFQRPDGNYETWYIRDRQSGNYLDGFASWELVEGRLLAFLLNGPMNWLGLTETAVVDDSMLYRLTPRAVVWLQKQPAPQKEQPAAPFIIQPDGIIQASRDTSRHQRFQLTRIADLTLPVTTDAPYYYQITPASLNKAKDQGIAQERILTFLTDASQQPLPAGLKRAIIRWTEQGTEGRLQKLYVLRVADPAILNTLRQNPKTQPYLGETLGELAITVPAEHYEALLRATTQLGLLISLE